MKENINETIEVLNKIRTEIMQWYWDPDVQSIAKDSCVVDAMIDLFVRTINKYRENETNKITIEDYIENLSKENLSKGDNTGDNIDQMKKDFIEFYLKGYASESELNKALKILNKYKRSSVNGK